MSEQTPKSESAPLPVLLFRAHVSELAAKLSRMITAVANRLDEDLNHRLHQEWGLE